MFVSGGRETFTLREKTGEIDAYGKEVFKDWTPKQCEWQKAEGLAAAAFQ